MPRKKHEWYIGARLHVIARGNHRNNIFRDETDYELYLNYLNEAMEYYKNKYQVIAYVLMTNHVHIIYVIINLLRILCEVIMAWIMKY